MKPDDDGDFRWFSAQMSKNVASKSPQKKEITAVSGKYIYFILCHQFMHVHLTYYALDECCIK